MSENGRCWIQPRNWSRTVLRVPPVEDHMRRTLVAVAVLVTALGIPRAPIRAQDSTAVEKTTGDYVTREQIATAKFSSAYELIESMHNNWLRERIPSPGDRATTKTDTSKASYVNDYNATGKSFAGANGGIQVYVDGTPRRQHGAAQAGSPSRAVVHSAYQWHRCAGALRHGHGAGVIYVLTMSNKGRNPEEPPTARATRTPARHSSSPCG